MSPLRVWLVGFGTVGRWVADALDTQAERLASRFGCAVQVVGIANARDGFVYDAGGLNLRSAIAASAARQPITAQPGARAWPTALEGLRATEADLLVEVTASPRSDAEPGLSHIRRRSSAEYRSSLRTNGRLPGTAPSWPCSHAA